MHTPVAHRAKLPAHERQPEPADLRSTVRRNTPSDLRHDLYFYFMDGGWTRLFLAFGFSYLDAERVLRLRLRIPTPARFSSRAVEKPTSPKPSHLACRRCPLLATAWSVAGYRLRRHHSCDRSSDWAVRGGACNRVGVREGVTPGSTDPVQREAGDLPAKRRPPPDVPGR